jgi:hypothetical protein
MTAKRARNAAVRRRHNIIFPLKDDRTIPIQAGKVENNMQAPASDAAVPTQCIMTQHPASVKLLFVLSNI